MVPLPNVTAHVTVLGVPPLSLSQYWSYPCHSTGASPPAPVTVLGLPLLPLITVLAALVTVCVPPCEYWCSPTVITGAPPSRHNTGAPPLVTFPLCTVLVPSPFARNWCSPLSHY